MEDLIFGRRYRVLEKIGTGGMADVFKAVDEVLGRTVAVKVMHPRYAADPSFAQRFRQEAQAAANLVSPNIVNMYDWGADGDTYYMVMEYVRGSDLKSIIMQKGALASAKVADIGAQVAAALSVAHGYDIIHRDIKPHNIMVQPDGSVKVMDFGIARAGNTTMTQTGSVLGTAHYVSPEQAQGKELHATSDLYSLGIVLYEAATGHLPFDADTPVAVALKQVNEQPKPPRSVNPNVDPGLEAVIVKAMQKNPAVRYSSADEMRKDLLAVAAGNTPSAAAALPGSGAAVAMGTSSAAGGPIGQTSVLPQVGGPNGNYNGSANRRATQPPRKKAPVWPWVLVVIALLVAGGLVANALGVFGNSNVSVPDLTGMTQASATAELEKVGLQAGQQITQDYSDTIPVGQVMSQAPTKGASVPKNTAVSLVLSKGPQPVGVPNIVGMTTADAVSALQAVGLVPVPGVAKYDATAPEGQILSQTPTADAQVTKGTQVTYVASKGKQPNPVVPDVGGASKSSAITALEKAGFKVSVSYDFDPTVPAGEVISQDPSSGGSYPAKTVVSITVSQGAGVLVPDVTSYTALDQAISAIKALGLKPSPSSTNTTAPVTISGTDPPAQTRVVKGSKVTIHYSTN